MVQHGLKAVALRFFNVYGPRQVDSTCCPKSVKHRLQDPKSDYSGVMSKFMEFASKSPYNIKVFGDGQQTRDFIYVKVVCLCANNNNMS